MTSPNDIPVRVTDIEAVTGTIKRFRFAAADGSPLPAFSAGSHVVVMMPSPSGLRRNPYSLMGPAIGGDYYEISVLRTADSRGGSHFMHDNVRVGSELIISPPHNLFAIDRRARKHLLFAGGIGITPFISMMKALADSSAPFEMHYAMRSQSQGAYWAELRSQYGSRVHTYFDEEQQVIPLAALLENQPLGTHLYVCGPAGMIDWVLKSAHGAGWPDENVHSERFLAPPAGTPFTVELKRSGAKISVGPAQSILEAIEAAGFDPPCLCRGGACGQCETAVIASEGPLQHNDHFLSESERSSGQKIMICVSRVNHGTLVLDL